MPLRLSKFAFRAYLILFTLLLMLSGFWLFFVFPISRQHAIANHLGANGVLVDWETGGSPWVEKYLGSYWCTEVVSVRLDYCENPREVLSWLPALRSLRGVGFYNMDLADDDLEGIADIKQLEGIGFYPENKRLTDNWLVHLKGLSNLKHLDYFQPIGQQGLASLSNLPLLEIRNLKVDQVSSRDLLNLPGLSKVEVLEIQRPIGNDWPKAVKLCPSLTSLSLTDASVTDQQLKAILQVTPLDSLLLKNVSVGGSLLPILADDHPELWWVTLVDTEVTVEQFLIHLGPQISSITLFDVDRSLTVELGSTRYFCWEGNLRIAKLDALEHCENCTSATVRGAIPLWRDLSELSKMPMLSEVKLECPLSDDNLRAISQVKTLSALRLHGAAGISPRGIAYLQSLPRLTSLEISSVELDDAHFQEIGRLASLGELIISNSTVTNENMAHLRGLQSLEILSLTDCKSLDDDALPHIAQMSSLSHLEINTVPLSDEGLIHLHGMPNLNFVDLYNTNGTMEGAMKLEKMLSSSDVF